MGVLTKFKSRMGTFSCPKGKLLCALVVALVLIMVTALFLKYGSLRHVGPLESFIKESAPTAEEKKIVQVRYTESGFDPKEIDIIVGTTVEFSNDSDSLLWVGSNPHPTHTDFSVFDAQKTYGRGEVYSFTFSQQGTFGYHNHEKFLHQGVVHVTDPEHPTNDISKTVTGQEAIRDRLLKMFRPGDPNSIFDIIDAIQSDRALATNCHDIAHDLGHEAYKLYGFSEAMTFNNPKHLDHPLVQYICAGGYMHGILEELSLHQPEFVNTPDVICNQVPKDSQESCYHGIGHVFMLSNERNVPEALTDCRKIEYSSDMYRCFEGIRMEQFWGNTDHVGTSSLGWDPKDPLATCIEAKTDEKPTCYLYSSFGYLRIHPKDYAGAVQTCTAPSVPESDAQFCLKGLGITMMSKFKGQNLEGSEVYVAHLPPETKRFFYQGVLGYAQLSGVSKEVLTSTCGRFKTDTLLCTSVLDEIF
jgi:plastocyanin